MSRRRICPAFLLLAAAGLLAGAAAGAPAAYVSFDASGRTWKIGNGLIERAVRLVPDGRFLTTSFLDKQRNRNWATSDLGSGEFRVALLPAGGTAPSDEIERTGLNRWQLLSESRQVAEDGTADLAIRLVEPDLRVAVTVHYRVFPEAPVVKSWLDVSNEGPGPVTVTAADAFALKVKGDGSTPSLFWVNNFTWLHADDGFKTNSLSLSDGRSAEFQTGPFGDAAAWFALQGTSSGDGLFGGWEWSGTGRFSFAADAAAKGSVALLAGIAPGLFAHQLLPGDAVTAPAGFVGFFSRGWEGAARVTRRLVESRYAPPLPDASFPWVGFDTWGYALDLDEGLVNSLMDTAADLGAESFTLDAGWMERIGEWRPRSGAFDGGIRALSDHAHARSLRFGLWMAFGVADPGSDVVRAHPDWVATAPGGVPLPGDFGSVVLCLANPETRAWVISEIDRVVDEYGVDWLLHDFSVIAGCADPRHGHQAGDGEWATTAGYYAILDEVRRRHPKLVIENCWNGGSMFDFGMIPRHDTSNTSDKNGALAGRQSVYGATFVVPPRYAGKYIADDGTPPAYRFVSGFPGGPFILMGAPTKWDDATISTARDAVALYKKLRPILRDGSFYRLTGPPTPTGWDAFMSYDQTPRQGVVLVYRGAGKTSEMTIFPRALPDGELFRLRCDSVVVDGTLADGSLTAIGWGDDFTRWGVPLRIPRPYEAAVLRFVTAHVKPDIERTHN